MPLSRALSIRPVNSEKHEVTNTSLAQNASTTQELEIIEGINVLTGIADQVTIGSTVKSVYIEFNLNGVNNSGASQVFHWMVIKNPSGELETADLDPALYNQKVKRHILKRGMEMLPEVPLDSGGTIQTKRIFVVKIPPRMRRFGQGDRLEFVYKSTSASGINLCFLAIYKAFS